MLAPSPPSSAQAALLEALSRPPLFHFDSGCQRGGCDEVFANGTAVKRQSTVRSPPPRFVVELDPCLRAAPRVLLRRQSIKARTCRKR